LQVSWTLSLVSGKFIASSSNKAEYYKLSRSERIRLRADLEAGSSARKKPDGDPGDVLLPEFYVGN
jgi:hypothetical protein